MAETPKPSDLDAAWKVAKLSILEEIAENKGGNSSHRRDLAEAYALLNGHSGVSAPSRTLRQG